MTDKKPTNYEEVYGTMTTTGGSVIWFGVYTGKHEWSNDNGQKTNR